jgi:hypothetical protein
MRPEIGDGDSTREQNQRTAFRISDVGGSAESERGFLVTQMTEKLEVTEDKAACVWISEIDLERE